MFAEKISNSVVLECKKRLLLMRDELINRYKNSKFELSAIDKMVGDEADQTIAQQEENSFLLSQGRIRNQLLEIDYALARIENGKFGICEETHEPIEIERLLALPQTRLSIEGAEIRESLQIKYAR